MTDKFEIQPQKVDVDPEIIQQIKEDLRDLFQSAKDPIAILLQTIETDEFKSVVPADMISSVNTKLAELEFEGVEDFVTKVTAVAMPVFEITKKGMKNIHKRDNSEMFTEADVKATVEIINQTEAKKIFVIGNVGSGKSTFARELSRAINCTNIDMDHWFKIFRQEQQREAADLKELLKFIIEKETPPFVINHADLLTQDLGLDADMIIYLNPKKDELLKSRQQRTKRGSEGEWQAIKTDDYDKITKQNLERLNGLGGEIRYSNEQSGTIVKTF